MAGFGLAGTAKVIGHGGTEIPLLHDSAADRPIPYTPVCGGSASFPVCLHPAYQGYLSQAVKSFDLVMPELAGLPGAPVRAAEVSGRALPTIVLDQAIGNGVVTGTPPVYEFTMDNALALVPDPALFARWLRAGHRARGHRGPGRPDGHRPDGGESSSRTRAPRRSRPSWTGC